MTLPMPSQEDASHTELEAEAVIVTSEASTLDRSRKHDDDSAEIANRKTSPSVRAEQGELLAPFNYPERTVIGMSQL